LPNVFPRLPNVFPQFPTMFPQLPNDFLSLSTIFLLLPNDFPQFHNNFPRLPNDYPLFPTQFTSIHIHFTPSRSSSKTRRGERYNLFCSYPILSTFCRQKTPSQENYFQTDLSLRTKFVIFTCNIKH
jgi:hypothetical protein